MENLPNQTDKKSETMTTVGNNQGLEKENGEAKPFFFETETKRLKAYYLENREKLVGRKILFNNSSGIVRYFGTLQHQGAPTNAKDELWIGIEWDEANRGKHNGTVNGFTYFTCPDNKGSMIKYEKIEFGYRLQTALFKRYFRAQQLHHAKDLYDNLKQMKKQLKQETEEQRNTKSESVLKKVHKVEYDAEAYFDTIKKSKKIMIEFIGFDEIWTKINNLDKIQSISLAECRICDLGQLGHLNGLLKSLRILSLEDNLLSDWRQIYQLGHELPQLTQLSISNNSIHFPTDNYEDLKEVQLVGRDQSISLENVNLFANLRCLILINTGLTWKSFFKVVSAFKAVHEFILCKNDLSDVQNIDSNKLKYMGDATFINLEETNQSNFTPLRVFGSLPYLEKLILNNNPLEYLGKNITGFQALKHLSVQSCKFSRPVVLNQISSFANLQSLNVKHNPMGDKFGNAYVRMRAVAEIQKLNQINGALLKKYERKDCEIFYMRESFREYFAFKKVPDYNYDFDDFLKYCEEHHPNIQRMVKKYGNPYEVQKKQEIQAIIKEEVKINQNKKGTGMVDVLIEYKQTGLLDKKKLPLSWTVSSLKNFFSKTIKIPVGMLKLTACIDPNATSGQDMGEDHKTLSFYNLRSGSRIIVERRVV